MTTPTPAFRAPTHTALATVLTISGFIGLFFSSVLQVEKIALLKDDAYIPTCTFDDVLACGNVMRSPVAEAFGVPNPMIGIAGFAVLGAIGIAIFAGAQFKQWFWYLMQAGLLFALLFVHYLALESLYVIGSLCPWCMVVWAVTILSFVFVTVENLAVQVRNAGGGASRAVALICAHPFAITVLWWLIIFALIMFRFGSYWF